jgi:ABC-2 type transport system permease protein
MTDQPTKRQTDRVTVNPITDHPTTAQVVRVIAGRECRDLWRDGRGPVLLVTFSVLLSIITYLAATNQALNFLERREAVNLVLQVAVAVGALVTMVLSADAVSGERERATLEGLIVTPASRQAILLGKWLAAMSWWTAAFAVALPYLWATGKDVSAAWPAAASGLLAGTVLAAALSLVASLISCLARTNRASLGASLLLLLALFAPTQLPTGLPQSWFADLLGWLNPVSAALHYPADIVVAGHGWRHSLSALISPVAIAVLAGVAIRLWGVTAMARTEGRTDD